MGKALFRPNKRRKGVGGEAHTTPLCTLVDIMESDYYLPESRTKLGEEIQPFQREILNHIFTPHYGKLRYNTVVWSCPKKSGKTALAAAIAYAWAKTYGGDIYSIANDLTGAQERTFTRVMNAFKVMKEQEPERFEQELDPAYHRTIAKRHADGYYQILFANGARLMAIPQDPTGEAGGMQSLTIWDELWGFFSENSLRLWVEMQPLPRGVGGLTESIRVIVTYAGWFGESELLYSLYEQILEPDENFHYHGQKVKGLEHLPCYYKDNVFVYWDHEARMPWHTPAFLAQAKNDPALKNRASEYVRIWENRWTTGLDAFIDMEQWDKICAEGKRQGLYNRWEHL